MDRSQAFSFYFKETPVLWNSRLKGLQKALLHAEAHIFITWHWCQLMSKLRSNWDDVKNLRNLVSNHTLDGFNDHDVSFDVHIKYVRLHNIEWCWKKRVHVMITSGWTDNNELQVIIRLSQKAGKKTLQWVETACFSYTGSSSLAPC